jgi:uncharacterized membrane protein
MTVIAAIFLVLAIICLLVGIVLGIMRKDYKDSSVYWIAVGLALLVLIPILGTHLSAPITP